MANSDLPPPRETAEASALQRRFKGILEARSSASADGISAAFEELLARYREPHRAYHNSEHLSHCFLELDGARAQPEFRACDFDTIEYALFYHDAIYAPYASTNEAKSAKLALSVGEELGVEPELLAKAERMIVRTAGHRSAEDLDEELLLDCDLSILGQDPVRFARYQRDTRREYRWIPNWYYARRRRAFLEGMLKRESVFHTRFSVIVTKSRQEKTSPWPSRPSLHRSAMTPV